MTLANLPVSQTRGAVLNAECASFSQPAEAMERLNAQTLSELSSLFQGKNILEIRQHLLDAAPRLSQFYNRLLLHFDAVLGKVGQVNVGPVSFKGHNANNPTEPHRIWVQIDDAPPEASPQKKGLMGALKEIGQKLNFGASSACVFNRAQFDAVNPMSGVVGKESAGVTALQALLCELNHGQAASAFVRTVFGGLDLSSSGLQALEDKLFGRSDTFVSTQAALNHLRSAGLTADPNAHSDAEMIHELPREFKSLCLNSPQLAQVVGMIDDALLLAGPRSSTTCFPLFPEGEPPHYPESTIENPVVVGNTLISGVKRSIFYLSSSLDGPGGTPVAPWQVDIGGEAIPFATKAELFGFLFEQLETQLRHGYKGDIVFPPLIYKAAAKVMNLPLPQWVNEEESAAAEDRKNFGLSEQKRMADNARKLAEEKRITARHKEIAQREYDRLNVRGGYEFLLATEGSSRTLPSRTFDSVLQFSGDSECQSRQLVGALKDSHNTIDPAYNRRGAALLNHDPRLAYLRDNQCWLRAIWISAFEQIPSEEALSGALLHAGLRQDVIEFTNGKRAGGQAVVPPQLLLLFRCYKKDPHRFLHLNEPHQAGSLANLRTGETFLETLNAFDVSPEGHGFKDRDLNEQTEYIFGFNTALLAAGLRDALRRVDSETKFCLDLSAPASSNVPAAVFRALGLPLVLIEHDRDNGRGATVRIAGPNGHALQGFAEQLVSRTATDGLSNDDVEAILRCAQHLPVLELVSDHYLVHLPKTNSKYFAQPSSLAMADPSFQAAEMPDLISFSDAEDNELVSLRGDDTISRASSSSLGESIDAFGATELNVSLINFPGASPSVVGRSPMRDDRLDHYLERLGVFLPETSSILQFCSPRSAIEPHLSQHPPLSFLFKCALQEARLIDGEFWVGRERLVSCDELQSSTLNKHRVCLQAEDGTIRSVILSESHLAFDGSKLDADALLGTYLEQRSDAGHQGHSAFLSPAGVGRSPALAILHAVAERHQTREFRSSEDVAEFVSAAIQEGRRTRGDTFLHNAQMRAELLKAANTLASF